MIILKTSIFANLILSRKQEVEPFTNYIQEHEEKNEQYELSRHAA